VDHYRARVPRDAGYDRRTVGLALTEQEWTQLEGIAREKEWSLAMVASQVVRLALRQRAAQPKLVAQEIGAADPLRAKPAREDREE